MAALVPITGTTVTTVQANVFVYEAKSGQWISVTPIYTGTVAPPSSGGGSTGPHTHYVADILDFPTLATVATTGEWSDILHRPVFSAVALSGEYADLLNAPVLAKVATTGLWSDLTGAPTLNAVATSGKYSDLTGTPTLATVATTGAYSDLTGTPTIPTVPVKGITAGTNITVSETNGIFTINGAAAGTGSVAQVNADWSASSGVAQILNKPTIPAKVSDLTNDSAFVDATGAAAAAPVQSIKAGANVTVADDGAGGFTIAATATSAGGTASGTVTSVTGTAPLHVTNGTTTPAITIDAATTVKTGVLRLATAAEVSAGTATGVAIDPDGLKTYVDSAFTTFTAGTLKTGLDAKAAKSHTHTVSQITDFPVLKTVATSAKYSDLTGTPTLATVATTGAYSDLTGTPTVPTKGSDLTNDLKWTTPTQAASAAPVQSIVAGAHITVTDDGAGNFTVNAVSAPTGGGTGTGGVTNVTGSAPIVVQNGSTTPAISVDSATTTKRGVVQLAEAADVSAGTTGRAVDAAQLKAELAKHALKSHTHTTSQITDFPTLATVATTGKYTDLTGTPTIPAAQVNSDWNATTGKAQILNKPTVPTKTSQLTNDSSFTTLAAAKAGAPVQSVKAGTNVTVTEASGAYTVSATHTKPDWTAAAGDAAEILHKPTLATVATTGSYADLTHKPTIPSAQVQSDWTATTGMGVILNKPTIPAAQVQTDWNATSGKGVLLNKPTLATVATTGSYNDLSDKPTITAGGSGTVTNVTGTAPIVVTAGTTKPVVSVTSATNAKEGVVRLATSAEVTNGTAAVVIDAAQAKATYAPLNHQTYLTSSGSDASPSVSIGLKNSTGSTVSGSGIYGHVNAGGGAPSRVGLQAGSGNIIEVSSGGIDLKTSAGTAFSQVFGTNNGNLSLIGTSKVELKSSGTIVVGHDIWPTKSATVGQVLTMGASNQMTWATPVTGGTTIPITTRTGISIPADKHPGSGIYARDVLGSTTDVQVGMASGTSIVDLQPSRLDVRSGAASLTGSGVKPGLGVNGTTGMVSIEGASVILNCSATGTILIGNYHWPSIKDAPQTDEFFLTSDAMGITSWAPVTKVQVGGTVSSPGVTTPQNKKTGFFSTTAGLGFATNGVSAGYLLNSGGWSLSSGETTTNAYVSINSSGIELRSSASNNPSAYLKLNADKWPTNKRKGARFDVLQHDEHGTLNWQPITIYDRNHPNQPGVQLDVLFELAHIISTTGWAGLKAKIAAS